MEMLHRQEHGSSGNKLQCLLSGYLSTSAVTPECDSNKFNCDDGTCIALNALCDSFEDCDNGSDEHNCCE
ncbi:low-density lipoprotein receptor isoform X2 [Octopus vulgaris]|uniref:Low-density lipoprotein receptor isoform X2 n=1 Tax=Octopus vulgaris TaxID=6645 RepID=A0AA36FBQ3_OCTVU|nr:low-density lipoprotein receptor isoform X2 [Octopus vulgaris]